MYHQDLPQSLLLPVLSLAAPSANIYISYISILDLSRWCVFACRISGNK